MEYGHGGKEEKYLTTYKKRLNPSFNGIWSWRNGTQFAMNIHSVVLILLLMEYGHGVCAVPPLFRRLLMVLILLLMEYGHGVGRMQSLPVPSHLS